MAKFVLLVLLLITASTQGANDENALGRIKGIVDTIIVLIRSIVEIALNANKIIRNFISDISANLNGQAQIENSLLVLVTTNDTGNCSQTESENILALITNTTDSVEECIGDFATDAGNAAYEVYDIFKNLGELVSNSTKNITECIANNNNNILLLPKCIWDELKNANQYITVLLNQLNKILPTVLKTIVSVLNTARSCITNIVIEFLTNIYNILQDFVICIEQL